MDPRLQDRKSSISIALIALEDKRDYGSDGEGQLILAGLEGDFVDDAAKLTPAILATRWTEIFPHQLAESTKGVVCRLPIFRRVTARLRSLNF